LELASSEIRFDIDPETGAPVKVLEKQHLETMFAFIFFIKFFKKIF